MHPRFHARQTPGKPAAIMSDTGETLTFGALEQRANQGAHLFRQLGITSGDTVAIWLPNSLHWYEVYWAAQRSGLYVTPLSTSLTAEEARYILRDAGAKLLLTSGRVEAAAALLARLRADDQAPHIFWCGDPVAEAQDWAAIRARQPATPIADERPGYHMVYSSGTTGRPKGVRLPLPEGLVTDAHLVAEGLHANYGIGERSVYLSPAPLYHTAPLVFTTMAQRLGATVVIMPKFEPVAFLASIERYRVSVTQVVPTMFIRLLRLPPETRQSYAVSTLATVIHAAAPCPVPIKHAVIEWLGPIIFEYYGGSEGNGSTAITSEEWLRKPGSVGRANWGVIQICDDIGTVLPPGSPGLIYFEGGWDFQYLNDPEKTRGSRHPAHPNWSTLGDIGYLDSDGYLFLTDRKSFMIISGGVNIYPQEIEDLLIIHPGVADVAVIGVPNEEMGEEVKAVIQPLNWADATPLFAADLRNYCREHLSTLKVPRSIDFVQSLPRQETGKLHKRLIRDRYWPGAGTPA